MVFQITHRAALRLYDLAWRIAWPVLRKHPRLSEGFEQRILRHQLPATDIWIQAASAGESYLAAGILGNLKPNKPLRILLTTNTRQGHDILREAVASITPHNRMLAVTLAYFPFDSPTLMQRAVRDANPKIMILVETEIWPGLLAALKKSQARIVIANGRLNEKNLKLYGLWPAFWKALTPDYVLAISTADARRFERLFSCENIAVMPNMKFDRVNPAQPNNPEQNPVARLLPPHSLFLVLGSIRQEEEETIAKLITRVRQQIPEVIIGLFPRHMHRLEQWKFILNRLGNWQLRSTAQRPIARGAVLLWDTFGELSLAYKSATAAFVGGSLAPLGGQNFLEPLVCGVPPVIGPSWENFSWVGSEIIRPNLLRVASNWEMAADLLVQDLKAPPSREAVQKTALAYIKKRQGGTAQICGLIHQLLENQDIGNR